VKSWALLAGLLVAGAAAADQTISVALGLSAAELGWQIRASDRLAFGARLAWDQIDREESLSLSAAGITAPARLDLAFERFTVSLEAAPGARRLAGRFRDAGCGCLVDTSPAYALQIPVTASLRIPLSEVARSTLFATLGADLLLSSGLLISPQAGVAMDAAVSPAVSLGILARVGRLLVVGDNVDPAILGGRRAITMPLALLLTIAVRL
jgi:hypothetical protein